MTKQNNGAPTARRVGRMIKILKKLSPLSREVQSTVNEIIPQLSPIEAYKLLANYIVPHNCKPLLPSFYFLLRHYAVFGHETQENLDELMIEVFKEILNDPHTNIDLVQDVEYALHSHRFWNYLENPYSYMDSEKPSGVLFKWLLSLDANDVKNKTALTKFQIAILKAADDRSSKNVWNKVARNVVPSLETLRTQTPTQYVTSLMTTLGRTSNLYPYFGEVVVKAYTRKPITTEVLRNLTAIYMGRANTPSENVDLVSVLRWYMAALYLFKGILLLLDRLSPQEIETVLDNVFIEWAVQNNFDLTDIMDVDKAQPVILYRLSAYIRKLKVYAVTDWYPYSVVMTILSKYGSPEQKRLGTTYLINKHVHYSYNELQAKYIETLEELVDKFDEWPHNLQLAIAEAIKEGHHWKYADLILEAHIKHYDRIKPFIQELLTTEEGRECVNKAAFTRYLEDDDFDYIAFLNIL